MVAALGELKCDAQIWGAAESLREAIASPLPPANRVGYELAVSTVRAQLGEQAFSAAWQEGRVMTPEQIIDDVLKRGNEAGKQ